MTLANNKMNHPLGDNFAHYFDKYYRLIKRESDRGAILVSASLLESSLRNLLECRLLSSDDKDDKLFGGAMAPLATFFARTEMAYRLGIISTDTKNMLNVFRKLRNDFAHRVDFYDFDDSSAKDRLKHVFDQQPEVHQALLDDARKHFENALIEKGVEEGANITFDQDWPIRATFDFFFASTAAALVSIQPSIKQIDSLIQK